jgi:hypothetical protein
MRSPFGNDGHRALCIVTSMMLLPVVLLDARADDRAVELALGPRVGQLARPVRDRRAVPGAQDREALARLLEFLGELGALGAGALRRGDDDERDNDGACHAMHGTSSNAHRGGAIRDILAWFGRRP